MATEDLDNNQPTGAPELPGNKAAVHEVAPKKDALQKKITPQEASSDADEDASSLLTDIPDIQDNELEDESSVDDSIEQTGSKQNPFKRFFSWYWRHKAWTLILTVLLLLGILFVVPVTRYGILGKFVSKPYAIEITDSRTHVPVSGVTVTLGAQTVKTEANGIAKFTPKVGSYTLEVSKKYYDTTSRKIFVGLAPQKATMPIAFVANGRQVPVTITDKLSGLPIANATIQVLGTDTKTDSKGTAVVVLPTDRGTQSATIIAAGYIQATATITVTNTAIESNNYSIVPVGKVYFLSNLSGTIDLVSTSLDGSDRQTVTAGTGNEDQSTQLYVSPDQKYAMLYAKRDDSGIAKLYVVDTAGGTLTQFDKSTASFNPVGWVNDNFVYTTVSSTIQPWQSNRQALVTYDATTQQKKVIAQTTVVGDQNNYIDQTISFATLINGKVVYGLAWDQGNGVASLTGRQDSIMSTNGDGSSSVNLKDIDLPNGTSYNSLQAVQVSPQSLNIMYSNQSGQTYYVYQNNTVSQTNAVNTQTFYKSYQTYLISPNSDHTYWEESRDGQSTFFIGDANGQNAKQIAVLDNYSAYGWDTDGYLLLSKDNSQLYIMPISGLTGARQPLKVSDYYAQTNHFD